MYNKKDPMASDVRALMERSAKIRQAEQRVNENFGVMARAGLPHEQRAAYDAQLRDEIKRIDSGNKTLTEGTISEAMKLVKTHTSSDGKKVAKVYRDAEWDEFRVKHYTDGKHNEKADYHTGDKDDAHSTAKHWVSSNLNEDKKKIDESVSIRSIQEEIYKGLLGRLNRTEDKTSFINSLSEEQVSIIKLMESDAPDVYNTRGRSQLDRLTIPALKSAGQTVGKGVSAVARTGADIAASSASSALNAISAVKKGVSDWASSTPSISQAARNTPSSATYNANKTNDMGREAQRGSGFKGITTNTTAKPAAMPTNAPDPVAPPAGGDSAGNSSIKPSQPNNPQIPDTATSKSPTAPVNAPATTKDSSGQTTWSDTAATAKAAPPAAASTTAAAKVAASSSSSSSSRVSDRSGGRFSDQPAWAAKAFSPDTGG